MLLEDQLKHAQCTNPFDFLGKKKLGDKTKVALAGFRDALLKNSAEALRAVVKPFKLEHKFKESEGRAGIFWIRMNKTKSSN